MEAQIRRFGWAPVAVSNEFGLCGGGLSTGDVARLGESLELVCFYSGADCGSDGVSLDLAAGSGNLNLHPA